MLRLLLALLALPFSPHTARAQVTPLPRDTIPAVYAYVIAADTVAYEAVQFDGAVMRGAYVTPGQTRISWDHFLREGLPDLLVVGIYPADAPLLAPAMRELEYAVRGDSVSVKAADGEQTRLEMVASKADAIPLIGRSMLQVALVAWFAERQGRRTLPVFMTSSARTFDATVQVAGELLTVEVDGLKVISRWERGMPVEITVPSQGLTVTRVPNGTDRPRE